MIFFSVTTGKVENYKKKSNKKMSTGVLYVSSGYFLSVCERNANFLIGTARLRLLQVSLSASEGLHCSR